MSDDREIVHIDASPNAPVMVEIDAEKIAAIIFSHCHTTLARAARAANAVVEYVIDAHKKGTGQ